MCIDFPIETVPPRMLNPRHVAGAQASPGKQLVRVEIQSLGGAAFQASWISPSWADMGLTWSQFRCWRNDSPIKNPDRGVFVTLVGWHHVCWIWIVFKFGSFVDVAAVAMLTRTHRHTHTHTGDWVCCGGAVDRPCPRLEDSWVIASLMSKIPHAGFVA